MFHGINFCGKSCPVLHLLEEEQRIVKNYVIMSDISVSIYNVEFESERHSVLVDRVSQIF